MVRYLAAPEATPQIGSDGEELARRRYLYGFPPVLEWGNGRCVVTGEISPGNRPSACQVGLALRSDNSKGSEYRGGMNITESFVGNGGLAVTGELGRRCAVIYAFPSQFPSGFRGTTGRKGGGWGEQREPCARARLGVWLETHRPRGLPCACADLPFQPFPHFSSARTCARGRRKARPGARALPLLSLPRLRLLRRSEVQLVFASHWLESPPFFPA